jgi:hypothetical protein
MVEGYRLIGLRSRSGGFGDNAFILTELMLWLESELHGVESEVLG